jgi:hypothetical protein
MMDSITCGVSTLSAGRNIQLVCLWQRHVRRHSNNSGRISAANRNTWRERRRPSHRVRHKTLQCYWTTRYSRKLIYTNVAYLTIISEAHTMQRRMIEWKQIITWKICKWKRSWPNLRKYPCICLEGMRKITKNLSQNSQYLGQDSNRMPLEYKLEAPLFDSTFSIKDYSNNK